MKNTEHIVNVYDRNDNIIGKGTEHINVTKVVRWDHNINGEILYSYNNHLNNGMVVYGLILDYRGFSYAKIL